MSAEEHDFAGLARWADRMAIDNECGPYWQSQFRKVRDALLAAAKREGACCDTPAYCSSVRRCTRMDSKEAQS